MKKKILIASLFVIGLSTYGQSLYVPGGASNIGSSTNENIGIGTSSPIYKLDVQGGALNVQNGENYFRYNGAADVTFKYAGRGDGGRAIVHYNNDLLYLNFSGDFSGGTQIGTNVKFAASSGDSYINTGNVGIGNTNPQRLFEVRGKTALTGTVYISSNLSDGTNSNSEKLRFNGQSKNDAEVQGPSIQGINVASYGRKRFAIFQHNGQDYSSENEVFSILPSGNVGIGTTTPTNQLEVNGTIRSKEVKVEASPWPDFVFTEEHELPDLQEVNTYIQQNGHLPEIPTAKEVEENGISLGEMNAKLLQKIEELTLYTIEQQKLIEKILERTEKQDKIIEELLKK